MRSVQALTGSRRGRAIAFALGFTIVAVGVFVPFALAAAPSNFVDINNHQVRYSGTGTFDWANSGAAGGTNTCTGSQIHVTGTNGLFDCGVFNGATTPPTAPKLIASDPSIPSGGVTFTADPLSVDVTQCAFGGSSSAGDPTVYTGAGSEKNGTLLTTDTYGHASVPNKDDLSNVYAVARRIDSGGLPTTYEVFFGGERVVNNGDSHIDYEFLQTSVSLVPNVNSKGVTDPCNGTFSGVRMQGDMLLSVDFTTGGTLGGTQLYVWDCNADPTDTGQGTQPPVGTPCDPPPHGQSIPHYQKIGSDSVSFGVNAAGAVDCGGWACRNADGTRTLSIATNELMEGGINLKDLGFTGCLGTFLPHTRSAQQFTATLKDFAVIPFNTCSPSTTMAVSTSPAPNAGSDNLVHTGDSVGFTWTETNDGNVSLTNPSVSVTSSPSGASCTPTKTGGDTNSNNILDAGEAWTFGCSITFSTAGSFTITGIGHGTFNGKDVTFCTDPSNPPSGVTCDQQEKTVSVVRVIAPSTTLTKTPSATTAHSGDSITYTYTELNGSTGGNGASDLVISSPSVTDDTCTPVTQSFKSGTSINVGDTDNDGNFDAGETWTFTCTTTITATTTNTATASGTDALGFNVTWCADPGSPGASTICSQTERSSATVTVINPGTSLDQVATATVDVTYLYKETNTGDTPLTSVGVSDPNCGSVSPVLQGGFNKGDTNSNNKLDPNEVWQFTCTKTAALTVATDGTLTGSFQNGASATGTDQLGKVIAPPTYTDEQHSATVTVSIADNGHTLP